MNLAETLRGLLRRWYVVVPGLVLAVAAAVGAYAAIPPGYQRTATQLLMPGIGTVPVGATNPYLYLGGLTQAADIVVRVVQSDEVSGPVAARFPGAEIAVERDPLVSGPSIKIAVTASSDDSAAGALNSMLEQTDDVLQRLQREQNVTPDDQMTVSTITHDQSSTLQQKNRLVASAGVGVGAVLLTLLLASLVDGWARRPRRSGRRRASGSRLAARAVAAERANDAVASDPEGEGVDDVDRESVVAPENVADAEPPTAADVEPSSWDAGLAVPDDQDDEGPARDARDRAAQPTW